MAGISSPVRTLYANCYKFLTSVLGTFTPAGLSHHSGCIRGALAQFLVQFSSQERPDNLVADIGFEPMLPLRRVRVSNPLRSASLPIRYCLVKRLGISRA